MIRQYNEHPIALALNKIAPLVGLQYDLRSVRDSDRRNVDRYPILDYVVILEQDAVFDKSKNSWRVNLVVQLDLLTEEAEFMETCRAEELIESQAIQAANWRWTGIIRKIIQIMIKPTSLAPGILKDEDIVWNKYEFRLDRSLESFYHRKKGSDELTGVSTRFVLSVLDADLSICCEDLEDIKSIVVPGSISDKLIDNKI